MTAVVKLKISNGQGQDSVSILVYLMSHLGCWMPASTIYIHHAPNVGRFSVWHINPINLNKKVLIKCYLESLYCILIYRRCASVLCLCRSLHKRTHTHSKLATLMTCQSSISVCLNICVIGVWQTLTAKLIKQLTGYFFVMAFGMDISCLIVSGPSICLCVWILQ